MLWRSKPMPPTLTIRNADEPVCAECRHSVMETRRYDGEYEVSPFRVLTCDHPRVRVTDVYRDIVSGEVITPERPACDYTRWSGGCGRNGAWWEAE